MSQLITISARLPFELWAEGDFPAGPNGPVLRLRNVIVPEAARSLTTAAIEFEVPDVLGDEDRLRVESEQAARLVRLVNRFLRWYRAGRPEPVLSEVTRAQLSPFRFRDPAGSSWTDDLVFEPPAFARADDVDVSDRWARVAEGFMTGAEPDVADLALADAIAAMTAGRFREAVLLCWSAIDATFTRRFEQLVDERLAGEWGDARAFLKGLDFGLRQKMTAGMRLVAGRSFFDLPNNFWGRLSESYSLRNRIIHRGESATEDEARRSVDIARELVRVVREI